LSGARITGKEPSHTFCECFGAYLAEEWARFNVDIPIQNRRNHLELAIHFDGESIQKIGFPRRRNPAIESRWLSSNTVGLKWSEAEVEAGESNKPLLLPVSTAT
jgi:hypothetical protein